MASPLRSGVVSWCVVALAGLATVSPRESAAQSPAATPPPAQPPAATAPATPPSLEEQIEALLAERRFKDAVPLAEQLVANAERAHGADHADVADALGVLSDAESGAGQTARAVSSLERAIAIREQAMGRDHVDVAQDCNALAVLFFGQGNYRAAEPLMTRALSIRERALGPDAPETAQSVNNLDLCINARVLSSPLTAHFDLVAGHFLTLLLQDRDNVGAAASAQRRQDQLHRSRSFDLFVSEAGHDRVAAGRLRYEFFGARVTQSRNLGIDLFVVGHDSTRDGRIIA